MKTGQFKFKKLLGEGAFGRVYLGEHDVLGADFQVCIKQEKKQKEPFITMFREEAAFLAKLRHFAFPSLVGYSEDNGDLGQLMVMSYIDGTPGDKYINKNGPVSDHDICWIIDRIFAGLSYLHFKWETVHCDLKPANLMLDVPGHEVTILDLGMAATSPDVWSRAKGGTPGYFPPEMSQGLPPVPQTDMYAVGKIGLYLATGDDTVVQQGTIPDDMHPLLQDFIFNLIQRDASKRPADADALREDLERLRHKAFGTTVSTVPITPRRTS